MPRPSASDTRYLEAVHGKWRVTVAVPRPLHAKLGTRLKRPLNTDSLALANTLKWRVVTELKEEIERHLHPGRALTLEAAQIAVARARTSSEEERHELHEAIVERSYAILGEPVGTTVDEFTRRPEPVYDPAREARAKAYHDLASGKATPIDLYHQQFLDGLVVGAKIKATSERVLKLLLQWCAAEGLPATLQAITRRVAARFMDALPALAAGVAPVTLNQYLQRLSRYWQWLVRRDIGIDVDVWAGLKLALPRAAHDEQERAFHDEEVRTLLCGPAKQKMRDLMRIGALTGARIDAIVDLKVKDCADGLFTFKPQKKETKPRSVPIHSALQEIVARRTEGRAPEDDLFPEWPAIEGKQRSNMASLGFTAYRRAVGVDVRVEGKRRALVNFHSFRRWFITKAERADQPESTIAVVVGHKRQGMTLGRYSAGPLMEQARRCVEAVVLPQTTDSAS